MPCDIVDVHSVDNKTQTISSTAADDIALPIKRYSQDYFDDLVMETPANTLSIPDANGVEGSALILRPRQKQNLNNQEITENEDESSLGQYDTEDGSLLLRKNNLMKLINDFIKHHSNMGECDDICLDIVEIQPWGLYCSVILKCISCDARSTRTKLYSEVSTTKRGRKAAEGNLRVALICQDLPIGPTETQLLFAAAGVKAGSLKCMNKNALKAADITEGVCRRDMQKWIDHAKDILKDRGAKDPDQIAVEFDALYHCASRANARCPGQGAVQATALCAENVTRGKKIVGYDFVNKLCQKGSKLKAQGEYVTCGTSTSQQHHGCSATQTRGRAIREYDMATRIAENIHKEGAIVTNLTTDSDGRGRDAFTDFNKKIDKTCPPLKWYKDLSHLTRNMKKKISAHSFKGNSFGQKKNGEKWNYKEKLDCRKALAVDVPRRVAVTLKNMRVHFKDDGQTLKQNVDKIREYMIECYNGNHTSCQSSPLAKLTGCSGKGKNCWFQKSSTLKAAGIVSLNLTQKSSSFLDSVIQMKLSVSELDKVRRGLTSSKVEATNRAINKRLTKNKTLIRTAKGKIASAIGCVNNDLEKFTHMKFNAMNVPMPHDNPGRRILRKYVWKRQQTRKSQTKKGAEKRRNRLVALKTAEYFGERKGLQIHLTIQFTN